MDLPFSSPSPYRSGRDRGQRGTKEEEYVPYRTKGAAVYRLLFTVFTGFFSVFTVLPFQFHR